MTFFPDRNPTIIRPFVPCAKVRIAADADHRRLFEFWPVPPPILLRTVPLRRRGRFPAFLQFLSAPVLPPWRTRADDPPPPYSWSERSQAASRSRGSP
jgi:hypothetical protein